MKTKKSILISNFLLSIFLMTTISCEKNDNDNDNKNTIKFGSFIDNRDGNSYKTITIGTQTWMAENLRYLPSVVGSKTGNYASVYDYDYSTPYYYVYDYEGTDVNVAKATTNYKTYGVLYNWMAAKIAAPKGWHIPTDDEWKILINYVGAEFAGDNLKETGTIHWTGTNTSIKNEFGFTALPGGMRTSYGEFNGLGTSCGFWSSKELNRYYSMYCYMYVDFHEVITDAYNTHYKVYGYSVRCIKD